MGHNTAANTDCLHFALNTAAIHHFIPLVVIININIALIFQPQILQYVSGCGDIGHCNQMDLSLSFQHHTFNVVIYLDFHSTKRALRLVDSWSPTPDQIQMYPDWDTIA